MSTIKIQNKQDTDSDLFIIDSEIYSKQPIKMFGLILSTRENLRSRAELVDIIKSELAVSHPEVLLKLPSDFTLSKLEKFTILIENN